MRVLILLVTIFCLTSCHPDKNKPVDLEKLRYQSTDASEIYFRNMRRSYYEIEENKEAAIDLYTLSGYDEFDQAYLIPTIAFNWRNDFVAIMLNQSDKLENEENLVVLFENEKGSQKLLLNEGDISTQTTVAVKVYNGILKNDEIFLVLNRQKQALFRNNEEKELFRITIFDFLRFVEMR